MNTFEIGKRIQLVRELRGLTREALSEIIDVSPRFLYDLELGFKGMSTKTLIALGSALGITTDYILLGRHPETPETNSESLLLIQSCPDNKITYLNDLMKLFISSFDK
ncbi:MAG: helix-turn-helix transcriptional regulator [Lachnospiraceae bacterium]|nr:helix-turn-helix transcriptional regulator [Lachnospiraceae bacterium]